MASNAAASINDSAEEIVSRAGDVPVGYKYTEVGVIPSEWNVERIDQNLTIKTGSKNTQDRQTDGEYPFFVRSQEVERINSYSYDGEAVLTAGDGVGTGKVFHYIRGRFDVHQRVYRITDFSDQLIGRYFVYQFNTGFYDRIMSMTAKSSVDSVRLEMIAGMKIPVPPPAEQQAIAEVLSDVDNLLESLDALIAKKRAIKQATMQQLLTGETRLPGFTKEWEPKLFGEVVSIRNEKVLPCHVDPGTICVELEHIASGEGQLLRTITSQDAVSSKYKFSSGDVLFGRLRPYLRKYWLADCDGICTTEIWPLVPRPGKMVSGFLFGFIQSEAFIEAANVSYGTHMPRADWGVMSGFDFLLPSPEEQTAIAVVLSDMDVEITTLQQRRDKTHAIKQAMMQQLLTGRIRLL